MRVVLVRPWTDAHAGSGCCGGEARDGVCFDGRVDGPREHDDERDLVGEAFRRLREEFSDVDVQIVGASNTAYLLPSVFRSVRSRYGVVAGLRAAVRAPTAGAVLIDGERIADILDLGVNGVLKEVRRRSHPELSEPSRI